MSFYEQSLVFKREMEEIELSTEHKFQNIKWFSTAIFRFIIRDHHLRGLFEHRLLGARTLRGA